MPAEEQLARGEIKVILQGKKLRGGFVLVHMGRAKIAKRSWDPEDTELSHSVLTGRTLEEIQSGRRERKRAA